MIKSCLPGYDIRNNNATGFSAYCPTSDGVYDMEDDKWWASDPCHDSDYSNNSGYYGLIAKIEYRSPEIFFNGHYVNNGGLAGAKANVRCVRDN